jgi:hypothetical protein
MPRIVKRAALVVTAAVTLTACATTSFHSTWRNPAAQPLNLKSKKVAALVLSEDTGLRYGAEDAMAREITAHGAVGVPAYSLIPSELVREKDQEKAKQKAKELLENAEVEGVVAMRLVSKDKSLTATGGGYWGNPHYSSFWGPGLWGWGWGGAYDAAFLRLDTIFVVETLVYSLPQDKLVWASQSQTTNPTEVRSFMHEVGKKVAEEMQKQGLLG